MRQGADGQYYTVSCSSNVGGANGYLTTANVPSPLSIGACVSACTSWNIDPAHGAGQRCEFGQIIAGSPNVCYLYSAAVYINGRDDGTIQGQSGVPNFIMTRNATVIVGACARPNAVSTSSSRTSTSSSSSMSLSTSSVRLLRRNPCSTSGHADLECRHPPAAPSVPPVPSPLTPKFARRATRLTGSWDAVVGSASLVRIWQVRL